MHEGEWVLRARHLALGYRHRHIGRDLSFDVRRGEILGIVGPNGCGKTTLLRTLLGLLRPLEGEVERQLGLRVSYLPQRDRIDTIVPLTALEVVLMGRAARAGPLDRLRAADRDAALAAMRLLGIEDLRDRLFRTLSTGQQQRVLIAKGLATTPDMLVLDEPTVGMDVAGETAIVEFLRGVNRQHGVTILLVTHLLPLVINLATSMMLMSGDSVLHGPIDDVLQEDRLTRLYGVRVRVGSVDGQRTVVTSAKGIDV